MTVSDNGDSKMVKNNILKLLTIKYLYLKSSLIISKICKKWSISNELNTQYLVIIKIYTNDNKSQKSKKKPINAIDC